MPLLYQLDEAGAWAKILDGVTELYPGAWEELQDYLQVESKTMLNWHYAQTIPSPAEKMLMLKFLEGLVEHDSRTEYIRHREVPWTRV